MLKKRIVFWLLKSVLFLLGKCILIKIPSNIPEIGFKLLVFQDRLTGFQLIFCCLLDGLSPSAKTFCCIF